jgi:two-component system cell cycle sensor histidine kinase/response regulator CckA
MVKPTGDGRSTASRAAPAPATGTPSQPAVIEMTGIGVVSGWNPAATLLYSYADEEILGHSADALCPPEGRAAEAAVRRRIIAGGRPEQYEADRVRKDGTRIRVSLTAGPVTSPAGVIVGVTATSWRISLQQGTGETAVAGTDASRREDREVLERSEVTDDASRREDREVLERSDVTDDAFRREGREVLERSDVTDDASRREDREVLERSDVTDDASRREDREVLELSDVTDDASRRHDREVLERSDVTDDALRRHDREVLERKERLQAQAQRLESLGQLAGGVAHDFNNLLAVILNYVSFVSEDVAAAAAMAGPGPADHLEAASADLGQIKKAAERAAGLTHQLLVFARRDVIRPQVLDLDTIITAIEEMLRRTIGEHVELVTSLAGDLWPVLADPGQLDQVLVNLAVNARDAMPAGGTLTIDTSNITVDADTIAGGSQARKGRNVRLRVSDNGTGMPAEVAQHAFEPFFTTKPDGAGTGLGLATVYGILAQADGNIQIYSEPGTGTTFTITLPATAETAAPIAEPAPYQRTPKGETVLVVEDEEALREVTRRIFTRNGYQVITAASGPEALGIADGHPGEIHLLVTDVVMPHMLGKEVAEKMRLIKPEIEVVFMSGYARPVLASQGRLDPGVALVEKPFSEADLLAVAGQVLNGHFKGFTTVHGTIP